MSLPGDAVAQITASRRHDLEFLWVFSKRDVPRVTLFLSQNTFLAFEQINEDY